MKKILIFILLAAILSLLLYTQLDLNKNVKEESDISVKDDISLYLKDINIKYSEVVPSCASNVTFRNNSVIAFNGSKCDFDEWDESIINLFNNLSDNNEINSYDDELFVLINGKKVTFTWFYEGNNFILNLKK